MTYNHTNPKKGAQKMNPTICDSEESARAWALENIQKPVEHQASHGVLRDDFMVGPVDDQGSHLGSLGGSPAISVPFWRGSRLVEDETGEISAAVDEDGQVVEPSGWVTLAASGASEVSR